MKNKIMTLLAILIVSGCSTSKVILYLDEALDHSKYTTYQLINFKSNDKSYSEEGAAIFAAVEKSISENMSKKNYEINKNPDLIVRYEIVSTITSQHNQNNNSSYNNNYATSMNTIQRTDKKITEGIILIEFRDRKLNKLVWQGSLDTKYSKKNDANTTLQEAVNEIFVTYPYVAGSNEKIAPE